MGMDAGGGGRTVLRALSESIRVKRTVNKLGTMTMEVEGFSETLINICKVVWCHMPGKINLDIQTSRKQYFIRKFRSALSM
jgi:hypothetical protein